MTDTTHATASTADDFFMSLTGFDEIAITKEFKSSVYDLQKSTSPMQFIRALAFVHRRREGDKDATAFESVMGLTVTAIMDYFTPTPGTDEDDTDDGESGARQSAADVKAAACLSWGLAPSEWDGLTLLEREAFAARAESMKG